MAPPVVNAPCEVSRLSQNGGSLLGISASLVRETGGAAVCLEAAADHTEHPQRPPAGQGDTTKALVAAHVPQVGTEREPPFYRIAAIAPVA